MENGYYKTHSWLKYWYGRADKCENDKCDYKNPKRYEWALIKGKAHEKKRENYIMLCPSCHRKYDYTEEHRKNISKARKGCKALNKKAVILNGEEEFESISKAAEFFGVSVGTIHNNIKGLSKKTKQGKWEYAQTN